MVAHQSSRLFDRVVARVGARDAAIVTAEAMSIRNENDYLGRSGHLVLSHVARVLGWTPAAQVDYEPGYLPVAF